MAINYVGTVSVFVADQQRAKDFYTNTLGFELCTDAELYPGSDARWIAVAPKGATTELILYLPDEAWAHYQGVIGKSQAITLSVTDLHTVYDDLKSKGVKFVQEPDAKICGTFAPSQLEDYLDFSVQL